MKNDQTGCFLNMYFCGKKKEAIDKPEGLLVGVMNRFIYGSQYVNYFICLLIDNSYALLICVRTNGHRTRPHATLSTTSV